MASDFVEQFEYNTDNTPNWFYMQRLRKNTNKSFGDYIMRWRAAATRDWPPIEEYQMKKFFIWAQEPQFLDKLLTVMDRSFLEVVNIGKMFEECLKNGSITILDSLQTTNKVSQYGQTTENKKNKEIGAVMAAQPSKSVLSYQTHTLPLSPYPQTPTPHLLIITTLNAISYPTISNAPIIHKSFLSHIQCITTHA